MDEILEGLAQEEDLRIVVETIREYLKQEN